VSVRVSFEEKECSRLLSHSLSLSLFFSTRSGRKLQPVNSLLMLKLEDIFDIQDEISLAILNAIKIKLFGAAKEAVLKKYNDNPEAYQLYLQRRFYYNKWAWTISLNKAIENFRAAIKIEPEYSSIQYSYYEPFISAGSFPLPTTLP
jgi:hypothetical protein